MTFLLNDLDAADNITKEPNPTNLVGVETKPRGGKLSRYILIRRDASKDNGLFGNLSCLHYHIRVCYQVLNYKTSILQGYILLNHMIY